MEINKKVLNNTEKLNKYIESIRKENKTISICQGHFNVIHPGHLRFLEFAKKQGDYLIVAVQGPKKLDAFIRDKFYSLDERSKGVASLEFVDRVFIFNDIDFEQIIKIVKPDAYIMGEEFSRKVDKFKNDIDLVEKFGGKVIFRSGEIHYTSSEFLEKDIVSIEEERRKLIHNAIKKQNIGINKLFDYIDSFNSKNILVIGDTIVDQYVACDALGMSSEAPVLVLHEIENKEYVGGAAIVARNIRAFKSKCSFISLVGLDEPARTVKTELEKENIDYKLIEDKDRQTTFKIRYMVGPQKILRVSRLKDYYLDQKMEKKVIEHISGLAKQLDGIIVSDFGYGMITPKILQYISEISKGYNIKLFGDSQTSSQIGNVAKFSDYFLITPSEQEARTVLGDKYSGIEVIGNNLMKRTNVKNIVLTLSSEGFITFKSTEDRKFVKTQHFPSLNTFPVDVVGAGDALLSGMAVSTCAGANIMEASIIGAATAAIAVSKMGNIPVDLDELSDYIQQCYK
ncbi:MAG: adenylyltransferase/cytidyltransferase family protein [Desulfobacula sp.]|nr:adenylyltransferase/cytidyltransferase family protein [Desulfobacula sp.]